MVFRSRRADGGTPPATAYMLLVCEKCKCVRSSELQVGKGQARGIARAGRQGPTMQGIHDWRPMLHEPFQRPADPANRGGPGVTPLGGGCRSTGVWWSMFFAAPFRELLIAAIEVNAHLS